MTPSNNDPLLQPFQLKHLTLRNRIFSSAHEPAYAEAGMPTDRYRLYHEEKAKGGIGLTMTAGSAVVAEDSPPAFGNLHAYDDAIVPWIRRLTDGIHEHGAACMIQLTHLGRRAHWSHADWLPIIAPSPLREPAHRGIPKEAENWDIDRTIGKYADAAERMKAGGMDGIELESYGHLLDSFYSPATNQRTDDYGGSLDNRLSFVNSVLRAIRKQVGTEFIVGLRIAVDEVIPEGLDEGAGLEILSRLESDGLIDFVNVIRGYIATDVHLSEVIPIHGMASAPHLDFAARVRAVSSLPILHASKIDDVATARHAIESGKVDLVGMTRAHIADPHIVRRIEAGEEARIRPCVGATYCLDRIYEAGEALCLHNAATSREATMPHHIERADSPRRFVVVGAGPAGLEAARVAGERGHEVIVLEAMPVAGGQVVMAARNPRRADLRGIIDWRLAELERLGVTIRYDTVAGGARRSEVRARRRHRGHRGLPTAAAAGIRCRPRRHDLGCDRWPRPPLGFRAALRRQRHPFVDVGGGTDRPVGSRPRDRDPGADARRGDRWNEPRSLRPRVQRDRHPDHAEPEAPLRPSTWGSASCRVGQRPYRSPVGAGR